MWPDNDTDRDFVNFTGVAETAAEIIVQAQGRPISIGVSGAWGVGKSSLVRLIKKALADRVNTGTSPFLFVEFNAWLYQGYDDARAALTETIARALVAEAEQRKSGYEKAKGLLKRVDWLRVAKLTAGSGVALALGLPPLGLVKEAFSLVQKMGSGTVDEDAIADAEGLATKIATETSGLLRAPAESSPPREIQALRDHFRDTLEEVGITLVVLIDDLDRCLPETAISTLEAMRLFLFMERTAFVIAADEAMIRQAVSKHFGGVKDELVTSYFDKLIQVPIRVPQLGTQEVRAYMMLLFLENSPLEQEEKEEIRTAVCKQLSRSWKGDRVDRAFMQTLRADLPADLVAQFDTADRLAPLMVSATQISGNPRLVKRFLNALAIRMTISRAHGVGVNEAVLAKLLLFERCGEAGAYSHLTRAVNDAPDGKPGFLKAWEDAALAGTKVPEDAWAGEFVREWLKIPPRLADEDLRGALYVSRENAPIITAEDRLSSAGAEVLKALLGNPRRASSLADELSKLTRPELSTILERLLGRASQEQRWGTPPILDACLAVTRIDASLGASLAGFLGQRPPDQIEASIVEKVRGEPWTSEIFQRWDKDPNISGPVKKAIRGGKA